MKQITFSNVVAVVAILLCFYAFAGEKSHSSQGNEKEYCIMKVYPEGFGKSVVGVNLMFSDGTFKHDVGLLPDDPTAMKFANVKMKELIHDGWELKENSMTGAGATGLIVDQYVFERDKQ